MRITTDAWDPEGFEARLAREERVVVLFHAGWDELRRAWEDAAPEFPYATVRADLSDPADPRREAHDITALPTLVYFEKGEPLDRLDGEPGVGLSARALHDFLEHVEALNEEAEPIPRWLKRRRQPTSRHP
ncbi:MAG: Thioredoxin [Thermoplasmata archaeon]|jgi:hypothetical protein|nr:Thioredoxin [Thermoplasmata archaeon]